ncbi:MAG: Dolichol kinase [Ignavibacteria bacterium]|nr:Dolichol kinase [Ignavibacteria bacterium]
MQITNKNQESEIEYTHELFRKGIHLTSLSIPIVYVFVTRSTLTTLLIIVTIIEILLDFLSRRNKKFAQIYFGMFRKIMRSHELEKKLWLNGASWVLISATMCVVIFPKIVAITAFTILIISDTLAALVGRKYGRHNFFDKSFEGSLAFFISAVLVIIVYGLFFRTTWTFFLVGIVACFIGAFAEAASKQLKMDDNFSIPLSIGITLWVGGMLAEKMGQSFLNII